MSQLIVVGAQWGDEGKGKVVDALAAHVHAVVRFQGGANAGHTLVVGQETYALSLLPSGMLHKGVMSVIGNGVVVDPWRLWEEIGEATPLGLSPESLMVSDTAPLLLPFHKTLDRFREEARGLEKIGTTGRGIGPALEDKVGRRSLRCADLLKPETLEGKLRTLLSLHQLEQDSERLARSLLALGDHLRPYIRPVWPFLLQAQQEGRRLLFEGAQGLLLDVDHGTYPFVTSSSTFPSQAGQGTGVPIHRDTQVLGVVKAYATRVGSGPFPTEALDHEGEKLGHVGAEVGTVTGRNRRCGWFDAVAARHVARKAGLDILALTKLDVLDSFKDIKICVAYQKGGIELSEDQVCIEEGVTPVYETFRGWEAPTQGARSWDQLPQQALAYVKRLETLVGVPIVLISTGRERHDMITPDRETLFPPHGH